MITAMIEVYLGIKVIKILIENVDFIISIVVL